jgi:hypothetical protein
MATKSRGVVDDHELERRLPIDPTSTISHHDNKDDNEDNVDQPSLVPLTSSSDAATPTPTPIEVVDAKTDGIDNEGDDEGDDKEEDSKNEIHSHDLNDANDQSIDADEGDDEGVGSRDNERSMSEMDAIVSLWVTELMASPDRILTGRSLYAQTYLKLGLHLTDDTVTDVMDAHEDKFLSCGNGDTRTFIYIDPAIFGNKTDAKKVARVHVSEASQKLTKRVHLRQAGAALLQLLANAEGGTLSGVDGMGTRLRQIYPHSPWVFHIIQNDPRRRFVVCGKSCVMLRSTKEALRKQAKVTVSTSSAVARTEILPRPATSITAQSMIASSSSITTSSPPVATSDLDFVTNYLHAVGQGPVPLNEIGVPFRARFGYNLELEYLRQYPHRFVITPSHRISLADPQPLSRQVPPPPPVPSVTKSVLSSAAKKQINMNLKTIYHQSSTTVDFLITYLKMHGPISKGILGAFFKSNVDQRLRKFLAEYPNHFVMTSTGPNNGFLISLSPSIASSPKVVSASVFGKAIPMVVATPMTPVSPSSSISPEANQMLRIRSDLPLIGASSPSPIDFLVHVLTKHGPTIKPLTFRRSSTHDMVKNCQRSWHSILTTLSFPIPVEI